MATTGTCELAASISAASELSAPGPVERRSGAGRPLTRAYPSVAKPALSSVRKPRQRMSLVRRPSQIASTWMPGRPKTTSAPSASRLSTRTWPPRRVLTRCFTGELFALAGCRSERGIEARRVGKELLRVGRARRLEDLLDRPESDIPPFLITPAFLAIQGD